MGNLFHYYIAFFNYKIPWFDKHPDWPYFPNHTNPNIVIEEIYKDLNFESIVPIKGSNEKYILAHKRIKDSYADSFYIFSEQFKLVFADRTSMLDLSPCFYPDTINNKVTLIVEDTTHNPIFHHYYVEYDLINFTKKELPQIIGKKLNDSIAETYRLENKLYLEETKPKQFENFKYLGNRVTGNKFEFANSITSGFSNTGGGEAYKSEWIKYKTKYKQNGFSYFAIISRHEIANFKMDYYSKLNHFYLLNDNQNNTLYFYTMKSIYKIYKR